MVITTSVVQCTPSSILEKPTSAVARTASAPRQEPDDSPMHQESQQGGGSSEYDHGVSRMTGRKRPTVMYDFSVGWPGPGVAWRAAGGVEI